MKTTNEDLRIDIQEVKNCVRNLTKSFEEFKNEQSNLTLALTKRTSDLEITQAKQGERIANYNIFQIGLSSVIGAIAVYLGSKTR
jgi:hypothetical protein